MAKVPTVAVKTLIDYLKKIIRTKRLTEQGELARRLLSMVGNRPLPMAKKQADQLKKLLDQLYNASIDQKVSDIKRADTIVETLKKILPAVGTSGTTKAGTKTASQEVNKVIEAIKGTSKKAPSKPKTKRVRARRKPSGPPLAVGPLEGRGIGPAYYAPPERRWDWLRRRGLPETAGSGGLGYTPGPYLPPPQGEIPMLPGAAGPGSSRWRFIPPGAQPIGERFAPGAAEAAQARAAFQAKWSPPKSESVGALGEMVGEGAEKAAEQAAEQAAGRVGGWKFPAGMAALGGLLGYLFGGGRGGGPSEEDMARMMMLQQMQGRGQQTGQDNLGQLYKLLQIMALMQRLQQAQQAGQAQPTGPVNPFLAALTQRPAAPAPAVPAMSF